MIIEEITTSYARKYGLPDYGSFEIFCSMKARADSTENNADIARDLIFMCKESVENQGEQRLKEFYEQRAATKEKLKEIINGSKQEAIK